MNPMSSYAMAASRVSLLGRRLRALAVFGEVMAALALIGVPLALASIAIGVDPSRSFGQHLLSLYAGAAGPINLHAAVLAALLLSMMDMLRRAGGRLASNVPFGPGTARLVDALIWLVMLFGVVVAVAPELQACMQAPSVKYGFDPLPLLCCAIVAAVLGLLRAFLMATHALKTENEGFV